MLFSKQPYNLGIEFPLHLTFISTFKEFNKANCASAELKQVALEHKINFLKLNVAGQDHSKIKIELAELSKALPLCSNSAMTSIVIDVETLIASICSIQERE